MVFEGVVLLWILLVESFKAFGINIHADSEAGVGRSFGGAA